MTPLDASLAGAPVAVTVFVWKCLSDFAKTGPIRNAIENWLTHPDSTASLTRQFVLIRNEYIGETAFSKKRIKFVIVSYLAVALVLCLLFANCYMTGLENFERTGIKFVDNMSSLSIFYIVAWQAIPMYCLIALVFSISCSLTLCFIVDKIIFIIVGNRKSLLGVAISIVIITLLTVVSSIAICAGVGGTLLNLAFDNGEGLSPFSIIGNLILMFIGFDDDPRRGSDLWLGFQSSFVISSLFFVVPYLFYCVFLCFLIFEQNLFKWIDFDRDDFNRNPAVYAKFPLCILSFATVAILSFTLKLLI